MYLIIYHSITHTALISASVAKKILAAWFSDSNKFRKKTIISRPKCTLNDYLYTEKVVGVIYK